MAASVKSKAFFPFIFATIFALGCPKRQSGLRLVYAPAPPPAAGQQTQAEPTQAMVIEEPAPPEPAQPATVQQVETSPRPVITAPRKTRPKMAPPVTAEVEPTIEPAGAPALQPSIEAAQAAGLKEKINRLAGRLQTEITQLERGTLPPTGRKTLHDAQMFLDQATQASNAGDFQRSLQLVKKAGLLVSAAKNQ